MPATCALFIHICCCFGAELRFKDDNASNGSAETLINPLQYSGTLTGLYWMAAYSVMYLDYVIEGHTEGRGGVIIK